MDAQRGSGGRASEAYKKSWGRVVSERYDALVALDGPYLDVGCSEGDYVVSLAEEGAHVSGFDLEPSPGWKRRPELFSCGSAVNIPYADNSYETAYSFEVLEHLRNPRRALEEMARVSRRNVLVSVPNCDVPTEFRATGLTYNHYTDPTHVQFFTQRLLEDLMREVGLQPVYFLRINRISPELLFFESQGLPRKLANLLTRICRFNPWSRNYQMTILALGTKQ